MYGLSSLITTALAAASFVVGSPTLRAPSYAGYLISTFSDASPKVQFHLSNGNNALSYRFLNGGQPVLASTVGTRGVRDLFLTSNSARTQWYLIATGEAIRLPARMEEI